MTRAVVVGSGPNGLAAAVTLADAGVDVTVIERADRIGGGARSAALTVPGLMHDECSGFHPLAVNTPFSRMARLDDHGLQWAWPEVQYSSPLADGTGAGAVRSLEETANSLGTDANAWRRVLGLDEAGFDDLVPELLGPALHWPRRPVALARFGARAALSVDVLARLFREPQSRALFAGVAAHALRPFNRPMSAAVGIALASAAHTFGWPVAVGGSQAIVDAMVLALRARGGRIETGRHVERLDELDNADVVLLDVAPGAAGRIVGERMPPRIRRAMATYRHGPGAFKVDFAVDGGVPWSHEASRRAGTVHVGGTYRETAEAEAEIHRGRLPERPFVLVGQQHVADPSRSTGSLHPIYSYAHVPAGFQGDATDAIENQIERFAPGFRDRIVARSVQSTTEFSVRNPNYVGGDIVTGANTARQLVFRPRVTTQPYDLGVSGVYLCSAATPPGAGAHGMCGYNAATYALGRMSDGDFLRS